MEDYYVYAHVTPDEEVFYIGKGGGIRQFQTGNRSAFWRRIKNKYGYTSKLLEEGLTESEAYIKEMEYIASYKNCGQCKANFTLGGDGVRVEKRWWNDSISKSLMGRKRAKGMENKSYKNFLSKGQLYDLYVKKGKSSVSIGEKCGISYTTVIARLREYGIEIRKPGKAKVKIKCLTDGKEFSSISEAASFYNIFRENIRKVLHGKYKYTGGKSFAYVRENR